MGDFVKGILDNLYPWFYHAAGIVLLLALVVFFWFTFYGVNKFTKSVSSVLNRDERIKETQDKLDHYREENEKNQLIATQLSTLLMNITPYIDILNKMRTIDDFDQKMSETFSLTQRILDSLASDIKSRAGGMHRCGLWIAEDPYLKLYFCSAGFPKHYVGWMTLHFHNSVAGKSYIKKQTIVLDDVSTDRDWSIHADSKSGYKSLICIPIFMGVLTIDGLEPMRDKSVLIGEAYAALISGVTQEYFAAFFAKRNLEVASSGDVS